MVALGFGLEELFEGVDVDDHLVHCDVVEGALVGVGDGDVFDGGEGVGAGDDAGEDGVFAVQVLAGAVGDEELGTVGVFALVRHAHDPAGVVGERPVEFVREVLVPDGAAAFTCAGWVAALEHEVADIPVEHDSVVVTFLAQLGKIPHRLGCKFRQQF